MATPFDPGYGPPPGSTSDTKLAPHLSFEQEARQLNAWGVEPTQIDGLDPGFQPPRDPVLAPGTKARARLVYRDIPLVTIQNAWSVEGARGALQSHQMGIFEASAQLWDSILGDDRVTATLNSRATGLFGREVKFKPADDSTAAKEVCEAWIDGWPRLAGGAAMREMNDYAIGMGFSHSQLVWDTSAPVWRPYMRPWHPRFCYYHWALRKYIALSQDGQVAIEPGNGKWVTLAPFGEYRGWIRGAIRATTEPWMLRHFAFRDMARFSEIHGIPTRVGKVPAASDPGERAAFEASLANLGADTSMILPTGVDGPGLGYDYGLVEAKDTAWEVFPGLIDRCDMAIVLALLFQNLTTEVKGGSFAATDAHMDIRQSGIQGDNNAWKHTLYNQVARPFAFFNFGDADLAPWTEYDVISRDELAKNADQFAKFATAIETLKRGGVEFKDLDALRQFAKDCFGLSGIPLLSAATVPVANDGGFGAKKAA